MSDAKDIGKYQINNEKTVQGQVIGENTIHQHFYGSSTLPKDKGIRKIKVLFLAANPTSTPRLAIDEEMHAIEQKFRAAEHRDALAFQSAWAVRPDDLLQLLNQHRPHIVHFSGHGSGQGLYLAGDNGQARLVTAQALKLLFTTLQGNIRLVFLNACYSREQALVLVETIDCVIGMKESIRDDAAIAFAFSFYRAVGFGRSIQEAFDQGITSLLLEGIPQEDIPELLVRQGVDANKVLLYYTSKPLVDPLEKADTKPVGQALVWNVPYLRNDYFTGREEILAQLHARFKAGNATALSQRQAMSGLSGIGKTQIAVQYAYEHRDNYQAVLWARAESHEALTSSFVEIARLLNLPEKDAQDQTITVQTVKRWLQTNDGWLLILDNADEPAIVREFLPIKFNGHVLLTTQAQALGGLAQRIEVNTFTPELGALFLLRRASLISPDTDLEQALLEDRKVAMQISEELGGLPLALDQAGAYIEETQCSLLDYQSLYRTRRAEMLKERGGLGDDHPESVATTWLISFHKVEQKSSVAAEMLRLCVFLAPHDIPEEIITTGAEHLGPLLQAAAHDPLELNKAIAALGAYSLIRHDPAEKTLSIQRLVQAVLRDAMPDEETRLWAERTVLAVNKASPTVEFATWSQWERYLPHALACADLIEQEDLMLAEAARLLNDAGSYLYERARYREAEPLLKRALSTREQLLGPKHLDTATSLHNLALLYYNQGKYTQAEPLYVRALTIREQALGPEHPDTAQSLNNLALLYQNQSEFEQAEPLYQRALAIYEKALGPQHPDTATSLNNLASLYQSQGKYDEAESLYQHALAIREQQLGPEHPDTAISLNNLALLYDTQGKYEQAEPLYMRALAIREQQLGPEHPNTAQSLNNLASLYQSQGKYDEAEPLYQRALAIREQALGSEHPDTAASLNNLASLYQSQGKYDEAEPLYLQALAIREKQLGPKHPATATSLNNLAELYRNQGKYEQAEPLYQRALAVYEKALGAQHPHTQQVQENYVYLLRARAKTTPTFCIRIVEEPLTPHNLTSIISAITDLSTKCWLIAKGRLSDLIEYMQTHDVRFTEESKLIITKITYNSPFKANFKVDLTASNVAEAITTTIDGVMQAKQRLEKTELENKAKAQEIEQAKQKADHDGEVARLEMERQKLAIEKERLEILEKRLEVQKKGIDYALEIAAKTVTVLNPNADEQTKALLIQTLLPNILQLQNGKGLELALPILPIALPNEEKAVESENDIDF